MKRIYGRLNALRSKLNKRPLQRAIPAPINTTADDVIFLQDEERPHENCNCCCFRSAWRAIMADIDANFDYFFWMALVILKRTPQHLAKKK